MSNASRKARGMRTQEVSAQWFRERGFPFATSTGAGRPGIDIENMVGLAPEVKARNDLNLTGFLKQACAHRDKGLPFVVVRPNGFGEARVGQWAVISTLEDFTGLLREAGYGDDLPSSSDSNR